MSTMEWIRHRRSVRTFDGNGLRPEDAQRVLAFANQVENPYGIPITWQLLDSGETALRVPVITGGQTYMAGKMRRVPHAEEAFGYAFERILLYAESLGLGSTWIAGTMDRPAFERAVALAEGEVMPCISPLGYPAKKMSMREAMMRKGVKADSRLDFGTLFFENTFDTPLTPRAAGDLQEPLEMVRLAPSAVNKQPWRVVLGDGKAHFYEKRSKGYVSADGWDLQKIDLGIAACHFACALEQLGRPYTIERSDPGIPAGEDTEYILTFVPA